MGALHDALGRALATDPDRVGRLQHARTSIRFSVAGTEEQVIVRLDRDHADLDANPGPAEIEIELNADQVEQFVAGELPLPAAVLSGAVTARGPARKYLQYDPILRGLLFEARAGDAPNR